MVWVEWLYLLVATAGTMVKLITEHQTKVIQEIKYQNSILLFRKVLGH